MEKVRMFNQFQDESKILSIQTYILVIKFVWFDRLCNLDQASRTRINPLPLNSRTPETNTVN